MEADGAERREDDERRADGAGGIDEKRQHLRQGVVGDVEIGEERHATALGRAEPRHAERPVRQEMKIPGQKVGKCSP